MKELERKEMVLKRCRKGDSKAMLEMSNCSNEKISNMWLVRAVLYGNEEAREILRRNRLRASNTLIPIENFIPGKRKVWFNGYYSAEELVEVGFDNLPTMRGSYVLAGLSKERVMILGLETGYESPDEDGFGAETYYDYYTYDEFFQRISDKVSDDDPFSAYGEGIKYTESRKEFLPELRVDWLVEDGIIKP